MKNKRQKIGLVFIGIIIGFLGAISPDLIKIGAERIADSYQREGCKDVGPYKCKFDHNDWYTKFTKDYPTLTKIDYYFQFGEGPLYWALTGRCSNKVFVNPSAAPRDSGKITMRDYFFSRCSKFSIDVSDLIYPAKDTLPERKERGDTY